MRKQVIRGCLEFGERPCAEKPPPHLELLGGQCEAENFRHHREGAGELSAVSALHGHPLERPIRLLFASWLPAGAAPHSLESAARGRSVIQPRYAWNFAASAKRH